MTDESILYEDILGEISNILIEKHDIITICQLKKTCIFFNNILKDIIPYNNEITVTGDFKNTEYSIFVKDDSIILYPSYLTVICPNNIINNIVTVTKLTIYYDINEICHGIETFPYLKELKLINIYGNINLEVQPFLEQIIIFNEYADNDINIKAKNLPKLKYFEYSHEYGSNIYNFDLIDPIICPLLEHVKIISGLVNYYKSSEFILKHKLDMYDQLLFEVYGCNCKDVGCCHCCFIDVYDDNKYDDYPYSEYEIY